MELFCKGENMCELRSNLWDRLPRQWRVSSSAARCHVLNEATPGRIERSVGRWATRLDVPAVLLWAVGSSRAMATHQDGVHRRGRWLHRAWAHGSAGVEPHSHPPPAACPRSQLPMLKQRWKILLFGIIMQYVHGIFTQLAHRMHQPQREPLHDVGFDLTPVSNRVILLSWLNRSRSDPRTCLYEAAHPDRTDALPGLSHRNPRS